MRRRYCPDCKIPKPFRMCRQCGSWRYEMIEVGVTPEQMFERIATNYYGADGFNSGANIWLTDPHKLAEVLAELFNRTN